MRTGTRFGVLWLGLMILPAIASAESVDSLTWRAGGLDDGPPVYQYDLSGPRLGVTFAPDGDSRSQFGWHFESQSVPSRDGPRFIVERVLLIGGVERDQFIPSGTLIFGARLPGGLEFGVGPSLTLGGPRGAHSAVVLAAGHSFRTGGIRIPVHLALALDKDGNNRLSIVTGWALRDRVSVH